MPIAATAKDVCLKEQGSQRYLKISGLKNLKKKGKVAPLYGYYRYIAAPPFILQSGTQVIHGAAVGMGDNKVRLSLSIDRRLGAPVLVAPGTNIVAESNTLTATAADVKTLAGSYTFWNTVAASTAYTYEPIPCKQADAVF